jgi:hypothetical protein
MEESMPSIYNEISKDAKARRQQYPQSLFDGIPWMKKNNPLVPTKDLLNKFLSNNPYEEHRSTPQGNNTNSGRGGSSNFDFITE